MSKRDFLDMTLGEINAEKEKIEYQVRTAIADILAKTSVPVNGLTVSFINTTQMNSPHPEYVVSFVEAHVDGVE